MLNRRFGARAGGVICGVLAVGTACAAADPARPSDSMEFVRRMGLGWNLGNTLEACGDWIQGGTTTAYETAWGNPVTTPGMIAAIRAAGFRSVRIPVAW